MQGAPGWITVTRNEPMVTMAVRDAPLVLAAAVKLIAAFPVPLLGLTVSQVESLAATHVQPAVVCSVPADTTPPVEATLNVRTLGLSANGHTGTSATFRTR